VTLTTGDGSAGDEAAGGLGLDAGVVDAAANVDDGAALGVALGADDAGAHAEPSKAMAINQRRITDQRGGLGCLPRLLCRRERVQAG
jgi:hypothetical protein